MIAAPGQVGSAPPAPARIESRSLIRAGQRTLFLRAVDREGRVGFGECSPLPGRSPDTLETCTRALTHAATPDEIGPALPAARFALETALLDLAAQAAGTSVAVLLAHPAVTELPCSAVVSADGAAAPREVHTYKVKIGRARLDDELAALARLRARHAAHLVQLRLDLNRAWTGAEAAALLPRLAALQPALVEEPCSASDLLALPDPPPVPIALDESVLDQPDATRAALERGLVRALVLKPALLGGARACAAWAELARAAGAVPLISHLFDGPVALAACAELALALARPGDPAPGLGPHAGLAAFPGVVVPQLGAGAGGGAVLSCHRPGLGVEPPP